MIFRKINSIAPSLQNGFERKASGRNFSVVANIELSFIAHGEGELAGNRMIPVTIEPDIE